MTDVEYMKIALSQAKKSLESEDVPIGAVIVFDGQLLAECCNTREKDCLTIAHAEINAITKANQVLGRSRLDGATIYVTKEPCLMCMGAILSAHIDKIVFGAYDPRFGTKELARDNNFNHKCEIVGGVLEEDCSQLISEFFKSLRGKNASFRKDKNCT